MQRFDVCNGDADGLCAVRQWRLHEPAGATLVTGLKHEIALLQRVPAHSGDEVNVFDLSMQRNREALLQLLDAGVRVRYFDHHAAPDIPTHAALEAHVDTASDTCTSLLVDRALDGAWRTWALVGAYGDNLTTVADRLAQASAFSGYDCARLRRIGEALNYNAYGDDERDVLLPPRRVHEILAQHDNPLQLLTHEHFIDDLDDQRQDDLAQARALPPYWQDASAGAVLLLPDAPWSRRVLGSLANEWANAEPSRAHAVLKPSAAGGLVVSVRAPLAAPKGAHALCHRFGGGGRARAAGIDHLPAAVLDEFVAAFAATRWA